MGNERRRVPVPQTLIVAVLWAALCVVPPVSSVMEGGDQALWIEILPYSNWKSRVIVASAEGLSGKIEPAEAGAALICAGGSGVTITCEERYLRSGEEVEAPDSRSGVVVTGRVLVDREPADGVRVALTIAGLSARRPLLLPLSVENGEVERELVTDVRGRFSTPPLADGTYRLELTSPGGRVDLLSPFRVPAPQELADGEAVEEESPAEAMPPVLDLGDLEVPPGLKVEFSVIDESGTPLSGAVVSASQGKPPGQVLMFQTRSDAEGNAILQGFEPAGPVQTACSMRGFSRLQSKFEAPPTWIECVLQPLAGLSGEVSSDGEAVEGATVSFDDRDRRTRTDPEGRFQLRDLDAGEYRLVVAAPGLEIAERSGALAPGEKRYEVVELEPAPSRWGRVMDATTGEPVAGARLVSIAPAGAVAVSSNREGELFFEAPSHRRITLEANAQGYPPHRVELGPGDGAEDEPWVVELATGGRIAVTVWSSIVDGPCVGCDVSLFRVFEAGEPPPPDVSLRTGEDGRAVTEDLPEGQYQLYLEEASSLGSSIQVRSGHNVKAANVKAGTVTEVVFGEPQQTVEIRFRPLPAVGWQLRCEGEDGTALYESQPDGSFQVRRRPGEALTLRLVYRGVSVAQGTLAPETGTRVELDLPRTSVVGRWSGEGEPAATSLGLRVVPLFQGGNGAWVMPGPRGRFEIPYLHAGAYRIAVGDRDVATFNLARDQDLDLGEVLARRESEM